MFFWILRLCRFEMRIKLKMVNIFFEKVQISTKGGWI